MNIPKEERAIILQGGGSLGAYEMGAYNLGEIIRIQREHDDNSISNKIFDFSSNTITRLIQDDYDDTVDYAKARFSIEYLKAAGVI